MIRPSNKERDRKRTVRGVERKEEERERGKREDLIMPQSHESGSSTPCINL